MLKKQLHNLSPTTAWFHIIGKDIYADKFLKMCTKKLGQNA